MGPGGAGEHFGSGVGVKRGALMCREREREPSGDLVERLGRVLLFPSLQKQKLWNSLVFFEIIIVLAVGFNEGGMSEMTLGRYFLWGGGGSEM